jgi:hypothetical protein
MSGGIERETSCEPFQKYRSKAPERQTEPPFAQKFPRRGRDSGLGDGALALYAVYLVLAVGEPSRPEWIAGIGFSVAWWWEPPKWSRVRVPAIGLFANARFQPFCHRQRPIRLGERAGPRRPSPRRRKRTMTTCINDRSPVAGLRSLGHRVTRAVCSSCCHPPELVGLVATGATRCIGRCAALARWALSAKECCPTVAANFASVMRRLRVKHRTRDHTIPAFWN